MNKKAWTANKHYMKQARKEADDGQESLLAELVNLAKQTAKVQSDIIRKHILRDIKKLVKSVEFRAYADIKSQMERISVRINKGTQK